MKMTELTFENAMYSWGIFWIVYWISGIYLTWKNIEARPAKNLSKVLNSLGLNMVWTFIGTVIIFYIPIRIINDLNIVNKLLLCNIITEIWFYHTHLMLHSAYFYKLFHKKHHEYSSRDSYALIALYCTWYEAVICNLLAVGLGPIMLSVPAPYLYIWFGLVALNSTFTHSGLKLGWVIDGSHDLHHSDFNSNFGTLSILDRIYGTYKDPNEIIETSEKISENQIKMENINNLYGPTE